MRKFSLVLGLLASCSFLPAPGFAQEPNTAEPGQTGATAEAEEVIVTGSNIPTAEEVGPNPVLVLNRDYIDRSGERTAEELVRNVTVAGPNGVPSSNNGAGATPGASSISLRGFDASDTLTLINGHRVAPYPVGTQTGAVTFVDLNSIPKAAIQSIEILKDGASSIYGADAVAGVVNIKFREDYRGVESNLQYGNTLDKDSGEFAASLVFGAGDQNTEVMGVLNFYHRNSIYNRDRGYSNKVAVGSPNASPLNLWLSRTAVLAAGVSPTALPDDLDTFYGHAPFLTNGNAAATNYTYTPRPSVRFNFNAFSEALPDSERYGSYLNVDHKICGDQLVLYADMFYQNVKTHYDLAPLASGFFQTPGNITLAIPPHAPGPTLGGPTYEDTNVPMGAFNPFNPFQQIISGRTLARLVEFGNRLFDYETNAFFSTLGLKGDKLFDGNWGYDAAFRYSQIKDTETSTQVSGSRFDRILNAADPIFNPNSQAFIGTTIPYNPFGDYRVPIATNSLPVDFATIHPRATALSKLATVDVNIYTTSLFKLPAGGVGLAFGGQFRRENLQQEPDDLLVRGDILGVGPGNITHAGSKTYAFYAEARIPIFGGDFTAPGFHSLEFTAAGRFENFLSNDTNVLVPKVLLRWQPLDSSLTVRATWGEGFHEPSLIELFGSPQQGAVGPFLFDPATKMFVDAEVPFIIRSNPNLQPEDSRAFTGGIVYTPKFLPGLTLSIDLYDIESKGRTIIPDLQNLIDRSVNGQLLPGEVVFRDASGQIDAIHYAFQNAGSQKARGVDFGLSYTTPVWVGTLTWLTQATYLDSFQFAELPGATEVELRGGVSPVAPFGADEGYLKWRGNSQIDWIWKGLDLGMTVHYLDGFHEILAKTGGIAFSGHPPKFHPVVPYPNSIKEHWIKQTWFFDVRCSYNFHFTVPVEANPVAGYSKNASETSATPDNKSTPGIEAVNFALPVWKQALNNTIITLGCNNVFGHDPPDAATGTNYADFLYDSTGRFVYISLTKKF